MQKIVIHKIVLVHGMEKIIQKYIILGKQTTGKGSVKKGAGKGEKQQ